MSVTAALNELKLATAEDRAAKAEAMDRGVAATRPLTVTRLGELCALGERMIEAASRRERAVAHVRLLFA
jgi:hypothetical protein